MRKVKLDYNKPVKNKVVTAKVLQSKGFGDLLKIRDYLRHQKHMKYENITLYKEEMEVIN